VLLPGLAPVPGGPDFAVAGGQFAVLGITEFKADNVSGQRLSVGHGADLNPVLAGIGRMVEHAGRASHPDIRIVRSQRAESDITGHLNRLPAFAGIERALRDAIRRKRPAWRVAAGPRSPGISARSGLRNCGRERVCLRASRCPRAHRSGACGLKFFLRLFFIRFVFRFQLRSL